MGLFSFLRREHSQPIRFVVATAHENKEARTRRIHTELQLAVAVASLSPEDRKAAVARAATVKFETPSERFARIERKAFAGMRVSRDGLGKA
jgi:hypothetical protein